MMTLKEILDRLSPKAKPPELQEAEREDVKRGNRKLDAALDELVQSGGNFANIVKQVVDGVKQERLQRTRDEKTSRINKT